MSVHGQLTLLAFAVPACMLFAGATPLRALPRIKQLDDCLGDFVVRVVCECGTCRETQPQALARVVGW